MNINHILSSVKNYFVEETDLEPNTWYITDSIEKEYYCADYKEIYSLLRVDPTLLEWVLFNESMGEYVVHNPFNTRKRDFNREATFQTQIDIFGPCVITTLKPPQKES